MEVNGLKKIWIKYILNIFGVTLINLVVHVHQCTYICYQFFKTSTFCVSLMQST